MPKTNLVCHQDISCQDCEKAGLADCSVSRETKLILVSINAGGGRKISRFLPGRKVDGRYIVDLDAFNNMLIEIGVETGEAIYT